MEVPQYTIRPNTERMVVPWIFKLLGLSVLFYGGIFFNVKFALGKEIPAYINIFIFVFLIILIATQIILYRVKFGKYKYDFYTSRIESTKKEISTFLFDDFVQAELKQGMFDKMFNTGSIKLSKNFVIGPISNVSQMKEYIAKLASYHIQAQERYKLQQEQMAMRRSMASSQQAGVPTSTAAQPTQQASPQPTSQQSPGGI